MTPVLRGARVELRPAVDADAPALAAVLRDPAVAPWFGVGDADEIAREWIEAEDAVAFVIEVDGEPAGSVQYYEETDPDYRHAGMDIFLATERHGRGLGADALTVLARYLFEELGHHRLVIDPAAANTRAIRAYERVSFRPVGLMRSYERDADGRWHDNLLMDMLAGELVEPAG
jgi:aminoglycoside 6'-N-acetyltransferase